MTLRSCLAAALGALAGLFLTPALLAQSDVRVGPAALESAPDPAVVRVAEALQLPEVFAVMAEEGRAYGATLEEEMFPGQGGAGWSQDVARIYAVDRTYPAFLAELSRRLSGNPALPEIEALVTTGPGRKASLLEASARRALLDDDVEAAARMRVEELAGQNDPHFLLVDQFIEANDLLEINVSGGMNGALAFYEGLSAGGAFETPMTPDDMLREVWGQEDAIRSEAELWIRSVLNLAYAPMTDAELRDYIRLSQARPMKVLNGALYGAFDQSFQSVSRDLGLAAARYIAGETL